MVRAYLLSLLARQYLAKGPQARDGFPHSWLVWEPGSWIPAARPDDESVGETVTPSASFPDRPQIGDALCFELGLRKPPPWTLRLGRMPDNDVRVNDMTVSRTHLVLTSGMGDDWRVRVADGAKGATYRGKPISPVDGVALDDGGELIVGGVALTFLAPTTLWRRVEETARRLAR